MVKQMCIHVSCGQLLNIIYFQKRFSVYFYFVNGWYQITSKKMAPALTTASIMCMYKQVYPDVQILHENPLAKRIQINMEGEGGLYPYVWSTKTKTSVTSVSEKERTHTAKKTHLNPLKASPVKFIWHLTCGSQ